jgi:2-oxo-4-hydroxy-4-carboxy--5-ureidoimidazoline (OHCU) decarboxylase
MEKKTTLIRGEQPLFPVTWELDDATIDRIVDRVLERIEARRTSDAEQIAEQVLRIIQQRMGMVIIEG